MPDDAAPEAHDRAYDALGLWACGEAQRLLRERTQVIFDATPDQIAQLSSLQLVQLLKRLLLAECRLVELPLRATFVPMQITIADGGEDGRVEWTGGPVTTDYFASRFCVFQAKAQNMTETTVRAEVVARGGGTKVLNPALTEVLQKRGSYVLFCNHAFTGQKIKQLRKAIEKTIRECKKRLPRDCTIEVLDSNRIADWANTHPAVALWLAELRRGRSVIGFLSHDAWALAPEISRLEWIGVDDPRFVLDGIVVEENERKDKGRNAFTFSQVAHRLLNFLAKEQAILRIAGPSGFGKTRVAFELFNHREHLADAADSSALLYADIAIVGDEILRLALEIADSSSPTILVVDECPDEIHNKLSSIARRVGSKLRLVTIDVETRVAPSAETTVLRLLRASEGTIGGIAKAVGKGLGSLDIGFIEEIAKGFPRMAILAAEHGGSMGAATISSAEEALDRVVWGRKTVNNEVLRVLEISSLFEWFGVNGAAADECNFIAMKLISLPVDLVVEYLGAFLERGIIIRRGDFMQVSPIPLAAALGRRRLGVMLDGRLEAFFVAAPLRLRRSLLRRLKWLDDVQATRDFAKRILGPDHIGNLAALRTETGSECLDSLVHLEPGTAMATIRNVISVLPDSELLDLGAGRRHLVWALEKLVFRRDNFLEAATLLRRLAALETEPRISNNATGQFQQLYQLYLAGTEAPPPMRLQVLDEGLASSNASERRVCVGALDKMLATHHFSRSGGAEHVGSDRLVDWSPKTRGEVKDYLSQAVTRLMQICLGNDILAEEAKRTIGGHIRGLLNHLPLFEIKSHIGAITRAKGFWPEAVQEVNEWLYFDSKDAPTTIAAEVRAYFDELLPADPIEMVLLFASNWQTALHDPDKKYDPADSDFEYGVRQLGALARKIAGDRSLTRRAIEKFVGLNTKTLFPFCFALAQSTSDQIAVFRQAIEALESRALDPNVEFFSGFIAGCSQMDPQLARDCVQLALRSERLKSHAIAMVGSGPVQRSDLDIVASLVASEDASPSQCVVLSYGKRMDALPFDDLTPLLRALLKRGPDGLWAILEIASMVLTGGRRPDRGMLAVLRSALLAPELFERAASTMDGYHVETLVSRLVRNGDVDAKFGNSLAKQLFSICDKSRQDTFHQLDDSVRKSLMVLAELHPDAVWTQAAKLLVSADWYIGHRLNQLLDPPHDDHLGAGILFAVPSELYLKWVNVDAKARARLVVSWLPMITKGGPESPLAWHPAVQTFVDEFYACDGVLAVVASRLQPTSWWGPIGPHLQPAVALLSQWMHHPKPEVRQFAQKAVANLNGQIEASAKEAEEDEVRLLG